MPVKEDALLDEGILQLIERIGKADIVVGSRYLSLEHEYRDSKIRYIGQRFFALALTLFTGRRMTDPTSGFQCINRRVMELFASGVFPEDFPDTDVLLMAHLAKLRVREVPVVMRTRSGGTSMHSGLKPFYYVVKMVLSMVIVALNYRRWRNNGC